MATKSKQQVFDAMQTITDKVMQAMAVSIDIKHQFVPDPISPDHTIKGMGVTYTIKLNGGADQDAPTTSSGGDVR